MFKKLDGVGPIDNRPSTDKLHHFVKKKEKKKMTCNIWHMTCDMWHMTCDTWYAPCDIWHIVGGEHFLKISAPKGFWFVIYDILKIRRKRLTYSLNEWINDGGDCRTAPATPGLLISLVCMYRLALMVSTCKYSLSWYMNELIVYFCSSYWLFLWCFTALLSGNQ